jgi:2'-hydroxyisoflavone reductase
VSPPPPFTFEQMLDTIVDSVGPAGTSLVWVDRDFLLEQGVGAENLPLWVGADFEDEGMACDPARATGAGLSPRPLSQTIRETLDHERSQPTTPDDAELSRDREAEVLGAWAERS